MASAAVIRPYRPADLERLKEITAICFEDVSIDRNIEARLGLIGSRDWRFGGRFSFLPGVGVSIEGVRRESKTAAPDQSVQLQFDATW